MYARRSLSRLAGTLLALSLAAACASTPEPARTQVPGPANEVSDRVSAAMRDAGFRQNPSGVWERRDDVPLDPLGAYRFAVGEGDGRTEHPVRCEMPDDAQAPVDLVALVRIRLTPRDDRVEVEVDPRFAVRTRGDRLAPCEAGPEVAQRLARLVLARP